MRENTDTISDEKVKGIIDYEKPVIGGDEWLELNLYRWNVICFI